ncbi:hypothetical protein BJ508DRAFT_300402 [Ascobolus immersus RN42]|uniref:Uncharacterized protein n=1 Tax=Ascobolus immersus RN42 TaxID=1160509 RepID=A0A3N4IQM8_ASCIM|nr:hypothetical protein BJ508DRAFT_300402 [Ascobolus immersus RN42]
MSMSLRAANSGKAAQEAAAAAANQPIAEISFARLKASVQNSGNLLIICCPVHESKWLSTPEVALKYLTCTAFSIHLEASNPSAFIPVAMRLVVSVLSSHFRAPPGNLTIVARALCLGGSTEVVCKLPQRATVSDPNVEKQVFGIVVLSSGRPLALRRSLLLRLFMKTFDKDKDKDKDRVPKQEKISSLNAIKNQQRCWQLLRYKSSYSLFCCTSIADDKYPNAVRRVAVESIASSNISLFLQNLTLSLVVASAVKKISAPLTRRTQHCLQFNARGRGVQSYLSSRSSTRLARRVFLAPEGASGCLGTLSADALRPCGSNPQAASGNQLKAKKPHRKGW